MTERPSVDALRARYFDRVRPVIGELLFERRVALWGLGRAYVVAEALARTGLRQQLWLDGEADESPRVAEHSAITRSLGHALAGEARATALASFCAAHNQLEQDFALERAPQRIETLREALPRDLLLAEVDEHAGDVARAAIDSGTPLVLSLLPRSASVGCVHVMWRPGCGVSDDALISLAERLCAAPRADADDAANHIDHLEAAAVALGLARFLLAPERPERPDLDAALERGRVVVARGEPSWPWSVRLLGADCDALLALLDDGRAPVRLPPALLGRERAVVLGLGTASVFCAEAVGLLGSTLLLLDCKDVSPENPVRQVYGTERVGQAKGRALAEILRARVDPHGQLQWSESAGAAEVTWLRGGPWAFGFGELRLRARDGASVQRFSAMLDELAPTIAVVGMGQSKSDNFTAAAALRQRDIRHVTPTAFPGVSHYKHILTDGERGPCYDCLQGHLAIDGGAGPKMAREEREMFYGGTQPATLAETMPSAFSLLRLARDLALPVGARPAYLAQQLAAERPCFVGANRAERTTVADGSQQWLYGVDRPFKLVSYGMSDLVGSRAEERCPSCGRVNRMQVVS